MSSGELKEIVDIGNVMSVPSFYPVRKRTFPTFEPPNPQYRSEGGHRFSQILRLRTSDFRQYYTIAATTIFFYDFLLTLADEVSRVIRVPLC